MNRFVYNTLSQSAMHPANSDATYADPVNHIAKDVTGSHPSSFVSSLKGALSWFWDFPNFPDFYPTTGEHEATGTYTQAPYVLFMHILFDPSN